MTSGPRTNHLRVRFTRAWMVFLLGEGEVPELFQVLIFLPGVFSPQGEGGTYGGVLLC